MARDDVIAYLESNAETLELPIELKGHVPRPFQEDGRFSVLELDGREQAKVLKSLGGRPLAVLSADRDQHRGWAASQDELAQLSSDSIHRTAHGSTHSALLEDERFASITTQTITDVVGVTRSGQRLQ